MSTRPEFVIVAAVGAEDRLIGNGLELPWHIPEDLRHFKRLTLGRPMLMGRKTFESLIQQFGKPLPGRRHLVVTRSEYHSDQAEVFSSIDEAVRAAGDVEQLIIAGGATIYEQFLGRADRMELTLVDGKHEGDVHFPEFEHLVGERYHIVRAEGGDGFRFLTYVTDPDSWAPDPEIDWP
ncbi:MAG: dihydrofolate reductase [Rhodothermales bacterium]|nr:dihydrofolate reductase [Rhodothermales bacterium]